MVLFPSRRTSAENVPSLQSLPNANVASGISAESAFLVSASFLKISGSRHGVEATCAIRASSEGLLSLENKTLERPMGMPLVNVLRNSSPEGASGRVRRPLSDLEPGLPRKRRMWKLSRGEVGNGGR
jgi:hypothetical protein